MIRPLTCICVLLAGGAGLFLYQAKHRTLMLDRRIERTFQDIEASRSKIGILQAEWALLNSPDRLAELGDKFLNLKPVAPTQFVTLADLDQRLPPPQPVLAEAAGTDQPAEPASPAAQPASSSEAPAPGSASVPPAQAAGTVALRREVRHERAVAETRHEAAGDTRPAHRNDEILRREPIERHRLTAIAERDAPGRRTAAKPATAHPSQAALAAAASAPRVRPARFETEARLVRPAPVYAVAPPPARVVAVYSRTPPVTASLLGGVHAVMAPPVPVADVSAR